MQPLPKTLFCILLLPMIAATPSMLNAVTEVASSEGDSTANEDRQISFELDVMPILTSAGCNQGACHGKSRGQNGFQLSLLGFDPAFDYMAIATDLRGRRVNTTSIADSLLLQKATAQLPHGGGRRLSPNDKGYEILAQWIAQGLPRRQPLEPKLTTIQVSPSEAPLVADSLQLSITAEYSDGSRRDVTELSDFYSSEPPVASVSKGGLITRGELPGEASVMIRYMGHIETWNVLIPQPNVLSPEHYAGLPRWNFIDDFVWKKLEQLAILPSEPADDSVFVRRAYLDVIGRLPNTDEVRAFLADTSVDKRSGLVDDLLQRPEYADHWANKWADLLRPNPYRVGIKATLNFDNWLRDAFRQNKRFDQFVCDLVTAEGSTWRNGATGLFRDRRSPDEVTAMISQLFLGVRLDCAKCHHHPFEIWSQDDFYGLAAYFSRVGYKGKGLSPEISGGEEIIFLKSEGEVKHPLTDLPVPPKPLSGTAEVQISDDPRKVLAEWMTANENPYFSTVAVNRIWAELMGRGLTEPVDDIRATNPPTNVPLLDALSAEFRRVAYDQKAMIRLIMTSYVYGISSSPNETNVADTRNYSRHLRVRLRAETLLDALSDITGVPEEFPGLPPGSRAMEIWTHRSLSQFLDVFGRPDPNLDPPCERSVESMIVQPLHLMNSQTIQRKLHSDNGLIAKMIASDQSSVAMVTHFYLAVYARFPTDDELRAATQLFDMDPKSRRGTAEDLLWALVNSPEFIFKN